MEECDKVHRSTIVFPGRLEGTPKVTKQLLRLDKMIEGMIGNN